MLSRFLAGVEKATMHRHRFDLDENGHAVMITDWATVVLHDSYPQLDYDSL
jgi:hypothetical protein